MYVSQIEEELHSNEAQRGRLNHKYLLSTARNNNTYVRLIDYEVLCCCSESEKFRSIYMRQLNCAGAVEKNLLVELVLSEVSIRSIVPKSNSVER